jgi:hypothetical protein
MKFFPLWFLLLSIVLGFPLSETGYYLMMAKNIIVTVEKDQNDDCLRLKNEFARLNEDVPFKIECHKESPSKTKTIPFLLEQRNYLNENRSLN